MVILRVILKQILVKNLSGEEGYVHCITGFHDVLFNIRLQHMKLIEMRLPGDLIGVVKVFILF